MDDNFKNLIIKVAQNEDKDIFNDTRGLESILRDNAKGKYHSEIWLLTTILDAGFYKEFYSNHDQNNNLERNNFIQQLHKRYSLDKDLISDMLDLLFLVIWGVKPKTQSSSPSHSPSTINISQNKSPLSSKPPTKQPASQIIISQPPKPSIYKVKTGMVRIDGGTFKMGCPANEPEGSNNEKPQHQVTVSSFYMGKCQVTQKEYEKLMMTIRCHFKGENFPVENVSWYDAVEYCNRLSQEENLALAYTINGAGEAQTIRWNRNANGYRLPTEAEWEFACRAGTTTPFYTGSNITTDQANYDGNSPYNNNRKGEYRKGTIDVGCFAPNAFELYDMHGNVWEWCWDRFGFYSNEAQKVPDGASSGFQRVCRGGCWFGSGQFARSAFRLSCNPINKDKYTGFRLVRSL